jgi:hypothetical protein
MQRKELMMQSDLKQKWIEALRSGEYKQGKGGLVTYTNEEPFYCCLGVLCDLLAKDGIGHWNNDTSQRYIYYPTDVEDDSKDASIAGRSGSLPIATQRLVGLDDWHQMLLANMNDTRGLSFTSIAEYIERNIDANSNPNETTGSGD